MIDLNGSLAGRARSPHATMTSRERAFLSVWELGLAAGASPVTLPSSPLGCGTTCQSSSCAAQTVALRHTAMASAHARKKLSSRRLQLISIRLALATRSNFTIAAACRTADYAVRMRDVDIAFVLTPGAFVGRGSRIRLGDRPKRSELDHLTQVVIPRLYVERLSTLSLIAFSRMKPSASDCW